MAEIKVLALDLDGTLTNDQKEVTPRTRAALDAAIERGVTVVLASGRPTAGITPLAKDLGLDKKGGCILSYNGGKIVDCRTGETLVEKTLDPALVPELCAFAAAQDVAILTYSSEGIVCERETGPLGRQGDALPPSCPMIHVDDLASVCGLPGVQDAHLRWTRTVGMPCAPPGGSSLPGAWTCTPPAPSLLSVVPLGVAKDSQPGGPAGPHGPDPGQPDGLRRRPQRPVHDRLRRAWAWPCRTPSSR